MGAMHYTNFQSPNYTALLDLTITDGRISGKSGALNFKKWACISKERYRLIIRSGFRIRDKQDLKIIFSILLFYLIHS